MTDLSLEDFESLSAEQKFEVTLESLAQMHRVEIDELQIEAYWRAADGDHRAIAQAMLRSRFMPTPAEVADYALGAGPDDAVRAFAAVKSAIQKHGVYGSVDFGPIANATVRSFGGWGAWCRGEVRPTQSAFVKAFLAMRTEPQQSQPLLGIGRDEPVRVDCRAGEASQHKLLGPGSEAA